MVNLINCSIPEFWDRTKDFELIAFGAGRLFESQYNLAGLKRVKFIIDNNQSMLGTTKEIYGKSIPILGADKLLQLNKERNAIVITVTLAAGTILKELDECENINGIDCYLLPFMINRDDKQNVVFPKSKQKIPKTIHYCWFGKKEIPDYLKKYMESWNQYCPEYKIVRWDESNYDVSKNQYMREAYESQKWGFVPDYARLDIIYENGGIYLDTDVEIIKSFDDLLCTSSFFGYSDMKDINLGHGFGAEKGNPLLYEMKMYYEGKKFIKENGSLDLRTCIEYQAPVFKKWGFKLNGMQEMSMGNIIYPREVFNPLGRFGINTLLTENTHSMHYSDISWETNQNQCHFKDSIRFLKERMKQ